MLVPRSCRTVVTRPRELPTVDRLLDDLFAGFVPAAPLFGQAGYPSVDSREDEKSYVVVAEIPGLGAKDVTVTVDGRTLEISGELPAPESDDPRRPQEVPGRERPESYRPRR